MKYDPLTTLTQIRKSKGLSRRELAEQSNVSMMTIASLEQGLTNPLQAKISTILAICRVLKCKPSNLYKELK